MKTLTIHFMDCAVVRTDNTGLINETGLVSWRERRGYKSATGDGIQRKAKGLVSCWWEKKKTKKKKLRPQGKITSSEHVTRKFQMQPLLYVKLEAGSEDEINVMLQRVLSIIIKGASVPAANFISGPIPCLR